MIKVKILRLWKGPLHLFFLASFASWYQVKGGRTDMLTITEWESISLYWVYLRNGFTQRKLLGQSKAEISQCRSSAGQAG